MAAPMTGLRNIRAVLFLIVLLLLQLILAACATNISPPAQSSVRTQWRQQADRVTIVRDDWGIAHVRGKTDADAVFGMVYAQAEDDFDRVETNYINAMGRLAEAEGAAAIWQDLRMKLFIQPDDLRARYQASPAWLQDLMTSWADGLNYYLATHKEVKPRVIRHFEPWMALSFSEGSIGGDIERVSLAGLQDFYENRPVAMAKPDRALPDKALGGSNGIAISPANSSSGNALLLINPHTSLFFRSELQMTSEEGLNAYGAVTWGQFFVYQGFNEHAGWMHTTSGVDVVDEYLETVVEKEGEHFYRHGDSLRPWTTSTMTIPYRAATGEMLSREFTVYRTHHGPIVRKDGDKWVSIALMHKPVEALSQSFLRTKVRNYRQLLEVVELKANSSNNTIFADSSGNIAYLHPQFIPRRDPNFDYLTPVDGSNPAADWGDLHSLDEAPNILNPPNGWIMNTNNWPYSAADQFSPRAEQFPRYMDRFGENPRGIHATMLLRNRKDFTLETLRAAAYDSYLPIFAQLTPDLIEAFDRSDGSAVLVRKLTEPIRLLRGWDYNWSAESIPTTLAIFWGETLFENISGGRRAPGMVTYEAMAQATPEQKLQALEDAVDRLENDFGSWRTPWGEINRFQRPAGTSDLAFSDAEPSLGIGFTSIRWGSLAAFEARRYPGTKHLYGTTGNSFVAVVEFGKRVRALAVTAGGASGDPASPHFLDQAGRYASGDLREVYFYPDQLVGHTERVYRPGEPVTPLTPAGQ